MVLLVLVGQHSREGRQGHLSHLLSLRLVHHHQGPVSSNSGAVLGPIRAILAPISGVVMVVYSSSSGDPHALGVERYT